MKIMKSIFALTSVALLAGLTWAVAPVSAVSDDTPLDTRSLSAIVALDDEDLDTRSYTIDWSAERPLNTKKIIGTLLLLR